MTAREIDRLVSHRLAEMYERHLHAGGKRSRATIAPGEVTRGYYPPELAGEDQDEFGICLVSTDSQIYGTGDYELRFALQSLSKVFVQTSKEALTRSYVRDVSSVMYTCGVYDFTGQ